MWLPQVGQSFYLANARFEILHTVYSLSLIHIWIRVPAGGYAVKQEG